MPHMEVNLVQLFHLHRFPMSNLCSRPQVTWAGGSRYQSPFFFLLFLRYSTLITRLNCYQPISGDFISFILTGSSLSSKLFLWFCGLINQRIYHHRHLFIRRLILFRCQKIFWQLKIKDDESHTCMSITHCESRRKNMLTLAIFVSWPNNYIRLFNEKNCFPFIFQFYCNHKFF